MEAPTWHKATNGASPILVAQLSRNGPRNRVHDIGRTEKFAAFPVSHDAVRFCKVVRQYCLFFPVYGHVGRDGRFNIVAQPCIDRRPVVTAIVNPGLVKGGFKIHAAIDHH